MINSTLHVFGWVIAIETNEDGEFVGASPYKTNFRGFSNDVNDKGYKKVTNYMENNIQRLVNAVEEE
ncbi:MAG: hypothetical protein K9K76_07470 [Halanaerobiales bacterium]|nr:hypothetical protein [Halanaerobiales bacterium]